MNRIESNDMELCRQKWVNEGGIYFPISGDTVLLRTPGEGVFNVVVFNSVHIVNCCLVEKIYLYILVFIIYKIRRRAFLYVSASFKILVAR